MAEKRDLRFQRWLVLLLLITAFSLTSHSMADAIGIPLGMCSNCLDQELGEGRHADKKHHPRDFHGRFLLNELPALGFKPARLVISEMAMYFGVSWIPSIPLRPPIIL
jgi:hypothetical protein